MSKLLPLGVILTMALAGCSGSSSAGSGNPVSGSDPAASASGAMNSGTGTVDRAPTVASGTVAPSSGVAPDNTVPGNANNAGASAVASTEAPAVSGVPASSALVGHAYTYQPAVINAAGKTLLFSIMNLPAWATFNSATGELTGVPEAGDVGVFAKISITVSDGNASASAVPFSIAVIPSAIGTATLSWVAPTQNTDGTALSNLAGYRIYYGASPSTLTQSVDTNSANVDSYVVNELPPGMWYFQIRAYTAANQESTGSNVVTKEVM